MADYSYVSAMELKDLYRRGELSPLEVTKSALERIDKVNPQLNAFVTVTAEVALQQARAAEESYRKEEAGLLAGVPGSLKDLTCTRGIRTVRGSLLHEDAVPDFDAPVARSLQEAGMVLLGKTNTPEFGWKGDSGNRGFRPDPQPVEAGAHSGWVEWWWSRRRRRRSLPTGSGE